MITGSKVHHENQRTDDLPLFRRYLAAVGARDENMSRGAARAERSDVTFHERAREFVHPVGLESEDVVGEPDVVGTIVPM